MWNPIKLFVCGLLAIVAVTLTGRSEIQVDDHHHSADVRMERLIQIADTRGEKLQKLHLQVQIA